MGMGEVLTSKYPADKLKDRAVPKVHVHAYVGTDDAKFLREQEKSLMVERRRLKQILDEWDPDMVADKARRDFKSQLEELNLRLRKLRRDRGL